MKPYVMFGVHPLFGDYVDAIHAAGGRLARVVQNVPEPERPAGEGFLDSLERYHSWLRDSGDDHRVELIQLEDYLPVPGEIPILGFRGIKSVSLTELLKQRHGTVFPPLVHPSAYVSPMAVLEEGVFVGAGAVVAPNSRIGAFSLVNRGATIGHDTVLESRVIVGPSAGTASRVCLGEGCVLGIGCTVIERIEIGARSYVAAGAVVLKDVLPDRLVAGVPAQEKKVLGTAGD